MADNDNIKGRGARKKICKDCSYQGRLNEEEICRSCEDDDKRKKAAREKDESESNCKTCKDIVKNDARGLQCDKCEGWYHAECQQVSRDMYKVLQVYEDEVWYCKGCKAKSRHRRG